jgi:hypothetical protein
LLRFLLSSGTAFSFYGGFIADAGGAHYSMSLTRSFSTPHTQLLETPQMKMMSPQALLRFLLGSGTYVSAVAQTHPCGFERGLGADS